MSAGEGRGREKEAEIGERWKVGMGDGGEMKDRYLRRATMGKAGLRDLHTLELRLAKSSINRVYGLY